LLLEIVRVVPIYTIPKSVQALYATCQRVILHFRVL
jgi:hypothetical protein